MCLAANNDEILNHQVGRGQGKRPNLCLELRLSNGLHPFGSGYPLYLHFVSLLGGCRSYPLQKMECQ